MIVPFLADGATDTLTRFPGERLCAVGQTIVITLVGKAAASLGARARCLA